MKKRRKLFDLNTIGIFASILVVIFLTYNYVVGGPSDRYFIAVGILLLISGVISLLEKKFIASLINIIIALFLFFK